MKRALRIAVLLLGLGVFGWFVHHAGPAEILGMLSRLGWYAPLALLPLGLVYSAEVLGWRWAFGRDAPNGLPYRTLWRIRLCGEAFNNVIPSGTVGGEAVKIYLLHKRGVSGRHATAATIIGRTVQTLMQVTFIALGSAAFLHFAGERPGVVPAMAVILAASIVLVATLFYLQSHGMFTLGLKLAAALRIKLAVLETRREHLVRIDRQIMDFYRYDRRHFLLSAATYLGAWLLDTLDVLIAAWLLGMPIDWPHALAIEAFIGVAKLLGFLVPGGLGIQEAGITLVCRLAGLPVEFGPAYAIIRRGRDLFVVTLGWWFLWREEASLAALRAHVAAEVREEL
ncbi:MAG: flippase-like domain-containing protein [Verrucomicrobia bacterium]|nr:flippase-like domain-containing protein [Verrucomicrobiota bacterium]